MADRQSIPCVFVAASGAAPLTGKKLALGDQPEHIPYVKAGCAVVAYEVDGDLLDSSNLTSEQLAEAAVEFLTAKAGTVNATNAIEFAVQRLPFVNPDQLYAAGHSSAGTVALLVAANYPMLRGCMIYAAPSDLVQSLDDRSARLYEGAIPDCAQKLKFCSPATHVENIRCPVYVFHSLGDKNVDAQVSQKLADTMTERGQDVETFFPEGANHYGDMMNHGIPKAIDWLEERAQFAVTLPNGNSAETPDQSFANAIPGNTPLQNSADSPSDSLPSADQENYHEQLLDRLEEGDLKLRAGHAGRPSPSETGGCGKPRRAETDRRNV